MNLRSTYPACRRRTRSTNRRFGRRPAHCSVLPVLFASAGGAIASQDRLAPVSALSHRRKCPWPATGEHG